MEYVSVVLFVLSGCCGVVCEKINKKMLITKKRNMI